MSADTTIYAARKFRLVKHPHTLRDGTPHEYEIIRHPGAAVILPLLADGRVVMIRNRRVAIGETLLELPAGTLDVPGEPPVECAKRELIEETGYTAAKFTPLLWFYSSPGFCDEKLYAFLATELTAGEARPEASEDLSLEILEWPAALEAARRGEIRDSKSLLTILHYDRFFRDGARR